MKEEISIPKIMYDQTQFSSLNWVDAQGTWISKEVYDNMEKLSGYKPNRWYLYSQANPNSFFFGAYDLEALKFEAEYGLKSLKNSQYCKEFEKEMKKMYQMAKEINEDYISNIQDKEESLINNNPIIISGFLKKIRKYVNFMMGYYVLTQPQRFYDVEKEILSAKESQELLQLMENGRELSPLIKLRKDFLVFVKDLKDKNLSINDENHKSLDSYKILLKSINQYGFLNQSILGGNYIDLESLKVEIPLLLSESPLFVNELKQFEEQENKIKIRNNILNRHADEMNYKLADAAGQMLLNRITIQTFILSPMYYYNKIISKIGAINGFIDKDVGAHTFNEIVNLLENKEKLSADLINQRKKGWLMIYSKDGAQFYDGNEAHNKIRLLLDFREKEIRETSELSGIVASWPDKSIKKISGKAFVLTSAFNVESKIESFKEGDILIATQTHPNLVPLMTKAKAIIADEGGITCHAAIVSRELGKPCVIGVRLGTKIINSGDFVEINLENGNVKRL